jgi:ribose/xylose/arabinose/galactoside ABC-type transport system permease subunit
VSTVVAPTSRTRLLALRSQLGRLQSVGVVVVLILVITITAAIKPQFVGSDNIANVATNASILAIVGFGMTLVIAIAGLDLSVGSVQAVAAILAAEVASSTGVIAAVCVAVAIGAGIGLVNGLITTKFAVPAFIATLGMASVARGFGLIHTNGASVIVNNDHFAQLGSGRILSIPVPVILALGAFALFTGIIHHTAFGRHVIAVGGNRSAATVSGLRIDRLTIAVYVIVGATAGVAGMLLAAQLRNVDGSLGQGFELNVIAVAVIGGASLAGGRANMTGTLLAALLVSSINAALNILNVESYVQYLVIGLLLIVALGFDSLRRRLTADPSRAT